LTEVIKDREYYRANRHLYEFPKFTLPTSVGLVEFVVAIPKENYNAFKILKMFDEYMDNKKPPEGGLLSNS
jgi:hypothetical protein